MLCLRNQWQEKQQGEGMGPTVDPPRPSGLGEPEGGQVRDHQQEYQPSDHPRLGRDFAQPNGPGDESSHRETRDRHRNEDGEYSDASEIDLAEKGVTRNERRPESARQMV